MAKRAGVKAAFPESTVGEQAKLMGQMWKSADPASVEPYRAQAEADKSRYEAEKAAQEAEFGVLDKTKSSAADQIGDGETVFPLARVKKMCLLDPEVKRMSRDAVALTAKATEFFLEYIALESGKISQLYSKKQVRLSDLADTIHHRQSLVWLREDFPVEQMYAKHNNADKAKPAEVATGAGAITSFFGAAAPSAAAAAEAAAAAGALEAPES